MTPTELIEAAARAIQDADEIGYSLNLTRLVDSESTYVLTYTDGSEPLEFSDTDPAYEHIARKRATARALAAASIIIEACANEVDALVEVLPWVAALAAIDGNERTEKLINIFFETLDNLRCVIRALAPVKEG